MNANKRITKQKSKNKTLNRYHQQKINQIDIINLNLKNSKKINRNLNIINSITRSMTTISETNDNITINNINHLVEIIRMDMYLDLFPLNANKLIKMTF